MSINQLCKPITMKRSKNLYIGELDTLYLAQKYGTPLYIIDETTLRASCQEYKKNFQDFSQIKMTYASKALSNLAIAKIIADEGFGFDVVSAGELHTLYKAGVNMNTVTFNGNNKSKTEIEYAIDLGIALFSVDNFYEAELLNKIAFKKNRVVNVLLRVTPGIECHTHEYIMTGQIDSKFGFDLSQLDNIVNLILLKYKNLSIKGLHAHIGSQIFEKQCYRDEINILMDRLEYLNNKFNLSLSELNIGGGLGIKYIEDDNPPSIKEFADIVKETLRSKKIDNITLHIEPGRSLVSNSGITLYTVGSSKCIPNGKKYIAVDGGMADNPRPSMYNAKYIAEICNNTDDRKNEYVSIAGRFCESGDILIENILLPSPKSGDILCVYNTGAYNYSMSSNYNKTQKPAMVLVNNSQSDIIVNRESLDDLISLENIPDRLKNDN